MGIYLVSVGAQEWFDADEEEGRRAVSTGLNEELRRRGLPPYESVPEETELVRGSGTRFEEKLVPPIHGFVQLAHAHLAPSEPEALLDWTVLVPVSLDEQVELPVESSYADTTVIAGAPQVIDMTRRLAEAVRLPLDEIPATCDNLDLTFWFLEGDAERVAAARPGPWAEDLDAAFYVALYLRAAEHSLRQGCPIVYS
ncbi:hypothetical protein [Streptomyces griseorubiginosus]|uniref:hypothetical protein n=1 Tax=Streptomyces griseorubiginosus TaxID=67304 RepID=UPI00364C9864